MGAFGSAAVTVFGVIWTFFVMSAGVPGFALFGVVFVIMGIVMTVYNIKNATTKNRYSAFDITDSAEEPDPLNELFSEKQADQASETPDQNSGKAEFCPYCGAEAEPEFTYCSKCGRKLPD